MTLRPMEITRNNFILSLCLLASTFSWSQLSEYEYQRDIKSVTEDWHRIIIPNDLFGKATPSLRDIRIYGLTEAMGTVEVPYLINKNNRDIISKSYGFQVINRSKTDQGHYFTLQLEASKTINKILLKFDAPNFDWRIQLEGSQDQQEWFSILEDYRIISIKNTSTDYQFTDLIFPDASYTYFRIFIPASSQPVLKSAEILEYEKLPRVHNNYTVNSQRITENKEDKTTLIDLDLEHLVPVDRIKIDVANDFDYFRRLQIQYLADSAMTEKGMKYFYRTINQNTLSSIDENEFSFQSVLAKKMRIVVSNNDNQPLKIASVQVSGVQQEIIARFNTPADYKLVYGNTDASRPVYDVENFVSKNPKEYSVLSLGNEVNIQKQDAIETTNWWEQSWILWSVMGVVILILGGFTYQMLNNSSENEV